MLADVDYCRLRDGNMANIKVAVRVRPISARESNLTGSEVVVRTDAREISLTNLKVSSSKAGDSRERIRKYGFDYCFDSSDPESENFADQARIYQSLGHTVLDTVFSGYNSCLVAYGQSASGKTYTMMGTKEDPGLTPRFCEGLFARIEEERQNDRNYCVSVSYLEIYNERVRDLLKPSSSTGGLRVREHPRLGPYVQGLTHHVVRTLGSLMSYVEEGTRARKTASTLQNPSSSRSHALLTIAVAAETQIVANGVTSCTSTRRNEIPPRGGSKLRLVDLAGSESAATCSGVHRLKEGANINKSLVALGNVISALAGRGSTGSGPGRRFIPYRDSSLTWLLKDALGGNATTIMLATISPARGSYNETAHTLRFAQRAQSVVNRPVVNEDPVARVIRELRAEVARLKSLLLEKNIEPDGKSIVVCSCRKNRSQHSEKTEEGTEPVLSTQSIVNIENELVTKCSESLKYVVPRRRSNSSDSVITCEVGSSLKKFGSLEWLNTGDRIGASYNRAKVTELNNEVDEVSEFHESVFVDIPTLVAVLIKPDDNLQESTAQIEEICSDEVVEEPIDVEFVETTNYREVFEKPDSIDCDVRSCSATSCHACGDNELDVYNNPEFLRGYPTVTTKGRPKFRKQDSVDFISTSVASNLHTSKRFGSVETIEKKKDPIFPLERSQTNLEKYSAVSDRAKKLNNIREIDDQRITKRNSNWRGSREQLQRKGSNDSDKSLKDSLQQNGTKIKNNARKPSLENLKRKTSKDSSSSSSKDEQISISSLSRDKLLRRKNSLDQESSSVRSHTPIQRAKRAEIVAAVTERLYSSRKQMEDTTGIRSPPESSEVKSMAKMKLQEISRKMLGKRRRVCVDTQTDCSRTVRMKDSATETLQVICQDAEVLTDDHAASEHVQERKASVLRVKEVATLTEKPSRTNIVRCKDVGVLVNDLDEYEFGIHSPRNDSGILSDDTQNYAESHMSSTEVSDLCQEADRRVAYAESSTNTSMVSSCRSFAVQTPRSERFDQRIARSKPPACLRRCCNSVQESGKHSSMNNSEKSVISISLPDTINITIESTSPSLEPRIAITDYDSTQGNKKNSTKDGEVQTEHTGDNSNEIVCSKDRTSSTNSQTDSRVFRIENIFQDPNNAANNDKVDRIMEGTRIRNSITFRNSLGTSYVSQPKEDELTSLGHGLHGEGFIRDGLITETFITRKRGINSKKAPSSVVYRDSWKNWQVPIPLVNVNADDYDAKKLEIIPSTCQPQIAENCKFRGARLDDDLVKNEEHSSDNELTINVEHDHGFSDDSLDYNETNVPSESAEMLKSKYKLIKLRDTFCPPDVVAHTKKDCAKSSIEQEKAESIGDFDNGEVEFPKKSPAELTDCGKVHDYKSLILGRPCFNYEEAIDASDSSGNRVDSSGKKKVSFSNYDICEQPASKQCPKESLKSIIKKRKKKNVSEATSTAHASNDETDDSQSEDQAGLTLENDWKVEESRSSSSEETREEPNSAKFKGNSKLNRKKVKFFVDELSENTCSESDSYENVEEEEEEEEDEEIPSCTDRNILEEYLSEAVTFMRNLNSINEYVNGTSMLERNPPFPCHGRHGKRGARRRSCIPGLNRDYAEFPGRKVKPKDEVVYPAEDDDIVASTESYDRCLKGIQRLEDCIRRVDKHNELLQEKYGVDCESAGARSGLASPNADPRVPTTNSGFRVLRGTDIPPDKRFDVTEQKADSDDLEKKIFDQLMNVANSIRYRNSNKLRVHSPELSDTRSTSPGGYSRIREKHSHRVKEPFCRDITASLIVEETSDGNDDESDFATFEITGNLSVGKNRNVEESDDNLDPTIDGDFLPLGRFNRSSWSAESGRGSPLRLRHDDSLSRKYRATDIGDSSRKVAYNTRGNSPIQWVSADSVRDRFHGTDDYSRRAKDGSWRVCACSKDHWGIECTPCEIVHLRDKLKYPGSPRARFLELLRERRRIVECSRGTSAS